MLLTLLNDSVSQFDHVSAQGNIGTTYCAQVDVEADAVVCQFESNHAPYLDEPRYITHRQYGQIGDLSKDEIDATGFLRTDEHNLTIT